MEEEEPPTSNLTCGSWIDRPVLRERSQLDASPDCPLVGKDETPTPIFVFSFRPLSNLGHHLRPCSPVSGPCRQTPQFKIPLLVWMATSDISSIENQTPRASRAGDSTSQPANEPNQSQHRVPAYPKSVAVQAPTPWNQAVGSLVAA